MKPLIHSGSIKIQFGLLLLGVVVALLSLSLWSYRALSLVSVNGELYERILSGENLGADVLPPPQYIIESFLVVNQLRDVSPAERPPLIVRLEQQRERFYDGQAEWAKRHLPQALKDGINRDVFTPADAFFNELRRVFLPALQGDDAAALLQSYRRLARHYDGNRAAVDRLVNALSPYRASLEAEAKTTIRNSIVGLGLVVVVTLCVVVALVMRQMARTIERHLAQQSALTEAHDDARRTAEAANRNKGEFLSSMSHELRTPMNAIIGMAHLALATDMTPKQRDYLGKIRTAADSLLAIINDILDFSKIEAGKLDLELRQFDLLGLLDKLETLLSVKAQEKAIDLTITADMGLPRLLIGDSTRLAQIFLNLCSNALKFTSRGGRVAVRLGVASRDGDSVRLHVTVRDNGIGVSDETAAELFRPYTQADASVTRQFGGTGLGLAISRQLVTLMGGEIGVNNKLEQGAEFWFTATMGVGGESEESSDMAMHEAPALRRIRVLVVEDNANARQICLELLPALGCKGVGVESAAEGLALLETERHQPFDLVLIDWMMPGIDGFRMAQLIRANKDLPQRTKIALMTAYSSDEIQQRVTQHQFDGFLVKPLTLATLFDGINTIFGRPTQLAREAQQRDADHALGRLAGQRALVVEDTEFNQQVACELLSDIAKMDVTLACDGMQALERLAGEEQFDIVLMDVQMPLLDGCEATRRIRRDPRHANLPIIAMTAGAFSSDRDACLVAGMNDFISKPVDPQRLFDTIARWLPEQARRQPVVSTSSIDADKGLQHCYGKLEFYSNLLRTFVDTRADDARKLRALHEASNFIDAARMAHTMKSVAATVGAERLSQSAMALQFALDGEELDRVEALLYAFELQLKQALVEATLLLETLDSKISLKSTTLRNASHEH